jgi:carbon storage regulator
MVQGYTVKLLLLFYFLFTPAITILLSSGFNTARFVSRKEFAMLVLSRNKSESIIIGNDIEIVVVNINGNKVRLGITAPREVPVHRREIYEAIQTKQQQSS